MKLKLILLSIPFILLGIIGGVFIMVSTEAKVAAAGTRTFTAMTIAGYIVISMIPILSTMLAYRLGWHDGRPTAEEKLKLLQTVT